MNYYNENRTCLTQVTDDCRSNSPGRSVEMARCVVDELDRCGTFMRGNPQLKKNDKMTQTEFCKVDSSVN